ncbi:hypothetical protein GQ53DRAFT_824684 [Thozetella sp. PMI_491]|nr:hypothetical protein GQ53DRAFT_824684 [Thozetella sp. PMI_491]
MVSDLISRTQYFAYDDAPQQAAQISWFTQIMELYNLEGRLLKREWLDDADITAGLRLVTMDLQDQVWISPYLVGISGEQSTLVESNPDKRFLVLVFLVHTDSHWTLLILDRGYRLAYYYDSLQGNDDVKHLMQERMADWLAPYIVYVEDYSVIEVTSHRQMNGSMCGVFVIEAARTFSREYNFNDYRTPIYWANSKAYTTNEASDNTCRQLYIRWIRLELGERLEVALRTPECYQVDKSRIHVDCNWVANKRWSAPKATHNYGCSIMDDTIHQDNARSLSARSTLSSSWRI